MTKSESLPFAYREVLAIVLRRIDGYSLYLIEYLWKYVSLTRELRNKGESLPFVYRRVSAIAPRGVGEYSLSLIECLCSYVSLI